MNIAITGKGGVGKAIIDAGFIEYFACNARQASGVAIDLDANLASILSFLNPSKITPLIEMKKLIEERTGVKPGFQASFLSLIPGLMLFRVYILLHMMEENLLLWEH